MNAIIKNFTEHYAKLNRPKRPIFKPDDIVTAWKAVGEYLNQNYEYDHHAKSMLMPLFHPEQSKGVCFCGSKGIGKTLNLDIFSRINSALFKTETEAWEVSQIEIMYKATGAQFLERISKLPALVINDAGLESKVLNDYGTNRNIIADLLFLRYREFQVNGNKTYISTNRKWEILIEDYGDKLRDRMPEMFMPVELIGESKRK